MWAREDWFTQYCEEEQYMAMQGGWVETQCYDIFVHVMNGLRQRWIPIDFQVKIERTDLITATIPEREAASPYGYFRVQVQSNEVEVVAAHPRWHEYGRMYLYAFDMLAPFPDVNWTEMNDCLEWIE